MKVIYGKRGSGKTKAIFEEALDWGAGHCVIVEPNSCAALNLKVTFKRHYPDLTDDESPLFISFWDFVKQDWDITIRPVVLIDELELCLKLFRKSIIVGAVSIDNDKDTNLRLLDIE